MKLQLIINMGIDEEKLISCYYGNYIPYYSDNFYDSEGSERK